MWDLIVSVPYDSLSFYFSIELFDIFQKCTFIHLGIAP